MIHNMNLSRFYALRKIANDSQRHPDTNKLARQIMVTENGPVKRIPIRSDHSLNLDGESWYTPDVGRRTTINGKYNSAAGLGQITAQTYLEYARTGRFPAKYFITDPNKISDFYKSVLSHRPQGKTEVGVNTIAAALRDWQKRHGEKSIGPYSKYIMALDAGTGVAHGADPGLSLDFHRDTYNTIVNDIDRRLKRVYTKFPQVSPQEAWERVAVSWKYPGRILAPDFDRLKGSKDYIDKFRAAARTINKVQAAATTTPTRRIPVNKPQTTTVNATTTNMSPPVRNQKYRQVPLNRTLWAVRNDATFNPRRLPWGRLLKAYTEANPNLNFNAIPPGTLLNIPNFSDR